MEQMTRRIALGAFLGVLLGIAIGYSPSIQPSTAPRAQLMMPNAAQPQITAPQTQPAPGAIPILVALIAGFVIAGPVFIVAKRRTR